MSSKDNREMKALLEEEKHWKTEKYVTSRYRIARALWLTMVLDYIPVGWISKQSLVLWNFVESSTKLHIKAS